MTLLDRRAFLGRLSATAAATAAAAMTPPHRVLAQPLPAGARAMTLDLTGGAIGVSAGQAELVRLAARHGFESVEARAGELASLDAAQLDALLALMKELKVAWGASGLPVDFRREESRFREEMKALPRLVAGLQRAGVSRVGTWLMPGDDALTYLRNLKRHAQRLREVATVLRDHGQRFGLEYVGTLQSRFRFKFPFVHTLAETRELIAEIDRDNMGVILDAWHWWMAGDTAQDILALRNGEVVVVDLNDAPVGIEKRDQKDGQRELPAATGVIDVKSFLGALAAIGYDGPARAEPFNRALNEMNDEEACAATIAALRQAIATAF